MQDGFFKYMNSTFWAEGNKRDARSFFPYSVFWVILADSVFCGILPIGLLWFGLFYGHGRWRSGKSYWVSYCLFLLYSFLICHFLLSRPIFIHHIFLQVTYRFSSSFELFLNFLNWINCLRFIFAYSTELLQLSLLVRSIGDDL